MSETQENSTRRMPQNKILFCEKPWQIPALALSVLVVLTFLWAFYLMDDRMEFEFDDLAISDLFHQAAGSTSLQDVINTVPPAVVGITGNNVNSGLQGSGVIVSSSGYLITAHHLVKDLNGIRVYVDTPSGHRAIEAQVVKMVPEHNLALLKMVTSERFMYLRLADANGLQPGQPVFAVGQALNTAPQVKAGNILETGLSMVINNTTLSHVLRTDAVYNWGQAGGALVNANGELAGINMAVIGDTGLLVGYALPADVLAAHFGDVISFKPKPRTTKAPALPATQQQTLTGSPVWWNNTQEPVSLMQAMPPMGVNVVMNNQGMTMAPGTVPQDMGMHPIGTRIGGYRIEDIIGLALLALVAGIVGGMMTMGGGVLQVVGMMTLFGYGMYLIRPVAYLTNVIVYGAAALRNKEGGLVQWERIRGALPWAIVGVLAGYFIGNLVDDRSIGYILGIFALVMSLKVIYELLQEKGIAVKTPFQSKKADDSRVDELDELLIEEDELGAKPTSNDIVKSSILGFPVGLISGLLGISGGVVGVPIQHYINDCTLRNAIANASVLVFWASLVGAVVAFSHGISTGLIDWQAPVTLAIVMAPGAYVGGLLGARLTALLDHRILKSFYVVIMLAVAGKMLLAG